jgi:putative glutamine amidotransferase
MVRKPVVLVPACNKQLGEHPFHVAGRKYVDAVRLAGAMPLVVPAAAVEDLDALLDLAHGVLLTGSASNVHPRTSTRRCTTPRCRWTPNATPGRCR